MSAGVVGGILRLYTSPCPHIPQQFALVVHLTFSFVDGGGLVGRAWVCVPFGTQQTRVTASGTGLRALSINTPSFLGLVSAAVSTVSRKRDNNLKLGGVDVLSVDFNRTCCVTAVNQRCSGGGNIWQMKMCARSSPPIEKEPSSLRIMMRLSTCRVIGEDSDRLSLGPSSCRRDSTC